jgi:hypothetical protein
MVVFVRERQAAEEINEVNNRCSRADEALLRRTIFEVSEKLSDESVRLIDLLKLLDLREDLKEDRSAPLKAGWVRCRS